MIFRQAFQTVLDTTFTQMKVQKVFTQMVYLFVTQMELHFQITHQAINAVSHLYRGFYLFRETTTTFFATMTTATCTQTVFTNMGFQCRHFNSLAKLTAILIQSFQILAIAILAYSRMQ